MITTYAAKVTEENVSHIIARAAAFNLTVAHLEDEYKDEYAEFGVHIYAILSVSTVNDEHYAVFTTMWEESFDNTFRFTHTYSPIPFMEIVALKNERP